MGFILAMVKPYIHEHILTCDHQKAMAGNKAMLRKVFLLYYLKYHYSHFIEYNFCSF